MPAKRCHPLSLLFLVAGTLLAGCAGEPAAPDPTAVHEAGAPSMRIEQRKSVEEQLHELQRVVAETTKVPQLGKGDLLNISVYDEPELSIPGVPVRPDGKISFPLVGDVQAAGRSVDELTADLTTRLRQFLLAPQVTVIVTAFNSLSYVINGEVVRPGVYPLVTDVTLTAAIASAGGLSKGSFRGSSVELADLTHALVSRQGKLLPVDFVRLVREGDLRFNVSLQSGDYISIPSGLSTEIYVLGEVKEPAVFAFREEMPMSKTLALAGGFSVDADLSRVHIVRGSLSNPTLIVINVKKLLAGEEPDVQLQPGDLVYVPPTALTTWTRMLDKIVPTITALQTGVILSNTAGGTK
ncbi:polysaccharide biosynthesis/export family protein [uncultured Lamprocystis sp.]|jgi:polysaccharide export outer membrane protein|uniref:polysaccharide biosynthesis/export family protein n=1 Tax=uncultured Lamprocystis sp. TaxID=543132 RepID=UPI0026002ADE|nr:polysaccharide biosynthesis/export family protein [uncultured Lamprocystis sp.]